LYWAFNQGYDADANGLSVKNLMIKYELVYKYKASFWIQKSWVGGVPLMLREDNYDWVFTGSRKHICRFHGMNFGW
jgi:hypothetical protein